MKYRDLTIIGTSHIAKESVEEVKQALLKERPDIVALELDRKRLRALLHNNKSRVRLSDIRKIGLKGFLFAIIGGWLQKKLGKVVNVEPGAEMITAVKIAKREKIEIALIDQDIELTLRKLSLAISWREKWNFFVDILKSIFFKKRELKRLGIENFDLEKVPSKILIRKLIGEMRRRYPNVYKVLVEERNKVMAEKLKGIMTLKSDKKIIAIVGAGHEEDIMRLVKSLPNRITYEFTVE